MTTLKVQRRNMENKAKKLRRQGYVTGVLYGKELKETIPIQIALKEAERIRHECLKGSQLYLDVEGNIYDVLLKEIDYNGMNKQILEMDFQALVKGQKVHCETEIVLCNKDKVLEGVTEQLLTEVSYRAYPEGIRNQINVDCGNLRLGDSLTVADLDIAKDKDIDLLTHLDTVVVRVITAGKPVEETSEEEAE